MLNLHIYLIYSGKDMDAYPLIREVFFFFLNYSFLSPFIHSLTQYLLSAY